MTEGRNHFAIEEWVDFVNQQLPETRRATMQSHLDAECRNCSRVANLWKQVHKAGHRETSYLPPEWALRYVKNAFTVTAKRGRTHRFFRIPRLVFDSLWHPAPAGIRSSGQGLRQMQCRSDELEVTLRFEPEMGSERVSVTGQISTLPHGRHGETLQGIRILVSDSLVKVAETSTNRFGEFHTSVLPTRELSLRFAISKGNSLVIPLDLSETTKT